MSSPLPRRAHQALVRKLAETRRRAPGGDVFTGHHNTNVILPLGLPLALLLGVGVKVFGVRGKFRTPVETVEVVPRLWRRESEVLRAVSRSLAQVPRCLADFDDWSLHTYLAGEPLSGVLEPGEPVGEDRMRALADFFARVASVPIDRLPELPESYWPAEGCSRQFLGWLAKFADDKVHRVNEERFGELFRELGVPDDAIGQFMEHIPDDALTDRPFTLLHTDVHRGNVVVAKALGGREQLCVIDWELALYGDPLHDLATHLVRMNYDDAERRHMTDLWARAMRDAGHERMTCGMETDLSHYLDFEYVQSVFPDVMRAALALGPAPADGDFAVAAGRVLRAMERAWKPLHLDGKGPDPATILKALRVWHERDLAGQRPWCDA
ncbi:aminoglycoside phosphotransferase family protein [Streptomyces sp. SID14478]|uniref:phosphotransferase family protein n=1 Tax=Streptomyces sp. SID14478 TaxID=2706073 RepID=UPI0013E0D4C4|nr:aminoglycoside phosphotransferase family protein [Streptomyces sp. SID14478]NEB81127.1 aminoglycoside phosphotransferase family protein [Streptomyces sp. SID14478]